MAGIGGSGVDRYRTGPFVYAERRERYDHSYQSRRDPGFNSGSRDFSRNREFSRPQERDPRDRSRDRDGDTTMAGETSSHSGNTLTKTASSSITSQPNLSLPAKPATSGESFGHGQGQEPFRKAQTPTAANVANAGTNAVHPRGVPAPTVPSRKFSASDPSEQVTMDQATNVFDSLRRRCFHYNEIQTKKKELYRIRGQTQQHSTRVNMEDYSSVKEAMSLRVEKLEKEVAEQEKMYYDYDKTHFGPKLRDFVSAVENPAAAMAKIAELQRSVDKLSEPSRTQPAPVDLSKVEERLVALEKRCEDSEQRSQLAKAQCEKLANENQELKASIEILRAPPSPAPSADSTLKPKVAALEKTVDESKKKITKLEIAWRRCGGLPDIVAAHGRQLLEIKGSINDVREAQAKLQTGQINLREKQQAIERRLADNDRTMKTLRSPTKAPCKEKSSSSLVDDVAVRFPSMDFPRLAELSNINPHPLREMAEFWEANNLPGTVADVTQRLVKLEVDVPAPQSPKLDHSMESPKTEKFPAVADDPEIVALKSTVEALHDRCEHVFRLVDNALMMIEEEDFFGKVEALTARVQKIENITSSQALSDLPSPTSNTSTNAPVEAVPKLQAIEDRVSSLENSQLETRLSYLEGQDLRTAVEEGAKALQARLSSVEQNVGALFQQQQAVPQSLSDLSGRMDSLNIATTSISDQLNNLWSKPLADLMVKQIDGFSERLAPRVLMAEKRLGAVEGACRNLYTKCNEISQAFSALKALMPSLAIQPGAPQGQVQAQDQSTISGQIPGTEQYKKRKLDETGQSSRSSSFNNGTDIRTVTVSAN